MQTHMHTGRMAGEHEDCLLPGKKRGLEKILPAQPSEGAHPANTLIQGFSTFLLFKLLG